MIDEVAVATISVGPTDVDANRVGYLYWLISLLRRFCLR